MAWRRYTLQGNYSQSNGTSVLTSAGLVAVPLPIVSASDLIVFNGKSYGASLGASPLRAMTLSFGYSKANSNTLSLNVPNANETELFSSLCTYHYRKLYFNAGVTKFRQSVSGSGSPPSVLTSYYFGISRWFKVF